MFEFFEFVLSLRLWHNDNIVWGTAEEREL